MRVGANDVTSQFRRTELPVAVTGERGLKTMMCTSILSSWDWSSPSSMMAENGRYHVMTGSKMADVDKEGSGAGPFVVLERYDGMPLRCSVLSGPAKVESNWTEIGLLVQCKSSLDLRNTRLNRMQSRS